MPVSLKFRVANASDAYLEAFDHTKLSAVNICPTWGILRYQMHKRMPHIGRELPLEMGTAMHEVFALVRLATLWQQLVLGSAGDTANAHTTQHANEMLSYHGPRLFTQDRWDYINSAVIGKEAFEDVVKVQALRVLDTSGYYDDDRDTRRTLSNMEEAAIVYIDRWQWNHPVWMRDRADPRSDVGIEIPFDIVVSGPSGDDWTDLFRLTGKIDGIRSHGGHITVEDNKTTSRLTESWDAGWDINHQFTGYMAAGSTFTGHDVSRAEVLGLQVPLPKDTYKGMSRVPITREQHQWEQWMSWLLHSVDTYTTWCNNPHAAPRYTHSCTRYFRTCSMLPFCAADRDEQDNILNEMETFEWSPLHTVGDTE